MQTWEHGTVLCAIYITAAGSAHGFAPMSLLGVFILLGPVNVRTVYTCSISLLFLLL